MYRYRLCCQYAVVRNTYLHIGTIGHVEHAQRDGSELSHVNPFA